MKHFITLNGLIPIKTVKNIVISINNNTFAYGLTSNIKSSSMEPSTARHNNKAKNTTYFYNNNDNNNPPNLLEFMANINLNKPANIENFIVNINLLNYYFNNNG